MAMSEMSTGSSVMDMSASSTAMSGMASMTGTSMAGDSMADSMANMTMAMSQMMMTFFTSTSTPLYSMQWTPSSTGRYAGTCIFLIIFAIIFRGILAIRSNFQAFLALLTHTNETEILRSDFDKMTDRSPRALLAAKKCAPARPWKINEAIVRAILDTILAGVSYLLMLAVMTMNVGYFLSILGGTFVGSFIFGGWTAPAAH